MTNNREFFIKLDEEKSEKIYLADGNFIETIGVGEGFLQCSTGFDKTENLGQECSICSKVRWKTTFSV